MLLSGHVAMVFAVVLVQNSRWFSRPFVSLLLVLLLVVKERELKNGYVKSNRLLALDTKEWGEVGKIVVQQFTNTMAEEEKKSSSLVPLDLFRRVPSV